MILCVQAFWKDPRTLGAPAAELAAVRDLAGAMRGSRAI